MWKTEIILIVQVVCDLKVNGHACSSHTCSGVHRPPEGRGAGGGGGGGEITIHDFITIFCHVGFFILQAVWALQPN